MALKLIFMTQGSADSCFNILRYWRISLFANMLKHVAESAHKREEIEVSVTLFDYIKIKEIIRNPRVLPVGFMI